MFDPRSERLDAVIQQAPELREYERWLETQRSAPDQPRDYLFSEDQVRFEPRKDDVAVLQPGLALVQEAQGLALRNKKSGLAVRLPGIDKSSAERITRALDGHRCLLEVRLDAGIDADVLGRFLRATFGLVVFCPERVSALERVLPCVEITRFPSSPYAVERPYWENMIAVRGWIDTKGTTAVSSAGEFVGALRRLHVIALMGPRLDSFYKPRSPVSDRRVAPGAFYLDEPRILGTQRGPLYLDGPRISLSLIGGRRYHDALYESVGDPAALAEERMLERDGLAWGLFLSARSERDADPRPWFFPPRPIQEGHWDYLHYQFRRAVHAAGDFERETSTGQPTESAADIADDAQTPTSESRGTPPGNTPAVQRAKKTVLDALARFHQGFVRLHPFHCANQSLAMNLVNQVLRRTEGSGIPHFILDHLALRLSEEAYAVVFARAAHAWVELESSPVKRLALLFERKQRVLAFIERTARCATSRDFEDACQADRDAAFWALVSDRE